MNPKQTQQAPVENDPKLLGEGNYTAARRYDKAQREFVESGGVDDAARAAKPKDAHEAEELSEAEKAGRDKARR
jgi:hypothetical protein